MRGEQTTTRIARCAVRIVVARFPRLSTIHSTSPHKLHSTKSICPCRDGAVSGKVSFRQSFMTPATGNVRQSQALPWLPFDVRSITWNPTYQALKDYQQAWFLNLLFASWISERPGYLPDDGQLWRLANART